MSSTIVLDLETQRIFQEVGGHQNVHKLGISLCGVYFYDTDSFYAFRENELADFEQYLVDHRPTIVGFNSLHFDLPVLQPYYSRIRLTDLPQVDILHDIERALRIRIKLDSIAHATLGEGKSGSGLDAIRYFRNNEWDKLQKYCLDDVRITRDVYEYGKKHGCIYYENASELRPIPVEWSTEKTILEILQHACTSHMRVRLTVVERHPDGPKRTPLEVDIREVSEKNVRVFSPSTHEEHMFPLARIVDCTLQETMAMHQPSLL